jgi:DeoR/GlpR family transcriptional regulator of sugar metabolism
MLPAERRQKILEQIRESGSVTVTELSSRFKVSEETIRRDLQQMEQDKLLNRVYGGAYLGTNVRQEVPITLRKESYRESKEIIANICQKMIQNGDTIILDSSTTAYYIAKKIINFKNVIVITNSLHIATTLSVSKSIRVICTGGELNCDLLSFTGLDTLNCLERYFADKAFVSCTGLSLKNGLTDSNDMQGHIRKMMLEHARERICIADYTKFGKTTLTQITPLANIDRIVTDKQLPIEWVEGLKKENIECFYLNQD